MYLILKVLSIAVGKTQNMQKKMNLVYLVRESSTRLVGEIQLLAAVSIFVKFQQILLL